MDADTPTIEHDDAGILAAWNEIRGPADDAGDADPGAASEAAGKADTAARARDAAGKFTAKTATEAFDQADAQKQDDPDALAAKGAAADPNADPDAAAAAAAAAASALPSPKSMPKDLADKHWATLPPEVQQWTQKRDQDYENGISRYRDRASAYDRVEAALAPYAQTLQSIGAAPEAAIGKLMSIDHVLRYGGPADKAAMLVQVANEFGVPLEHLGQVNPLHQQMLQQTQRLHSYESQQAAAAQAQAQRNMDTLTGEVLKFSEGKEHFGAVEQEILAVLPMVSQQNPNASPQEKLQRAYEIACNANPTVRAALDAQQREKAAAEARKKANEARTASATNRTPRGTVATTAAATSMEDTIRATAERLGMA